MIPVTILTGFLGSGKTTVLKNILENRKSEKFAIIENEYGETSVDAELLFTNEDQQIIEINSGCICCRVRGDLVEMLLRLMEKRDAGIIEFSRVSIETTGLADPAPVAQTFVAEEEISHHFYLDGIITVIDAVHGEVQLKAEHEAAEQVAFADRILISKTDLVDNNSLESLKTKLRHINVHAPIFDINFGKIDNDIIIGINSFSLERVLKIEPEFLSDLSHEHDELVRSFVYNSSKPFAVNLIGSFFQRLVDRFGADLMRYKGILFYEGFENRVVLQGIHMLMSSDVGEPWGAEDRCSSIVFIGRELPQAQLERELDECLVA